MEKSDLSSQIISLLQDYEFEDVMQVLVLCQIYFITENVLQDNQLEYTNTLANLLVSSYQEYTEESYHGTSQKH